MTAKPQPAAPAADPHWGAENRDRKAAQIVECLELLTRLDLSTQSCVDIGCGSGGISRHLAASFRTVTGVDPEPWQRWDDYQSECANLSFRQESIETLGIASDSVDVVVCNQVYEHVPSPQQLIAQIHRILRPGGVCYFAGPNLLYPVEPHVHWPFIHWIPRRWALAILGRFAPRKAAILDAYSVTYWRLRRWLSIFDVQDAMPELVKHRAASADAPAVWQLFRPVPRVLLRAAGFLSPGFIFLVRKRGA